MPSQSLDRQSCLVFVCVLTFGLALAAPTAKAAPADNAPTVVTEHGVSEAWLEGAFKWIASSEYRLTPSEDGKAWSAPNRRAALRTTWQDGVVTYQPRNPSVTWDYRYELTGLGRAGDDGSVPAAAPITGTVAKDGRLEWRRGNVTEWYVNDPRGIEQGFTLQARPAGAPNAPLMVEGVLSGLAPRASSDGQRVGLYSTTGDELLQVTKLVTVDAQGTIVPSRMESFGQTLRFVVDDSAAVYPIIIDPLTSEGADWTGDSGERQAYFGASIAGHGRINDDDVDDVVIGATGYDGGVFNGGGVFVWLGDDDDGLGDDTDLSAAGSNQPDWEATGAQVGGALGSAVTFISNPKDGGGDAVAAGARAYDIAGKSNAGRVSVWYSEEGELSDTRGWVGDGDQAGGFLGAALASGDVNQDGYGDLFVGAYAYTYSGAASQGGAVFLWKGGPSGINDDDGGVNGISSSNDDWSAGGTVANGQFGFSLAVGNVNSESEEEPVETPLGESPPEDASDYPDLAVGMPRWTNPAVLEGAVFIFHGNEPGPGIPDLSLEPDTQIDGNDSSGLFGYSVALGDVDGDGSDDLVAGAPYQESSTAFRDEGRVYLFYSQGDEDGLGGLDMTVDDAAWEARGNQLRAFLGWSVAVIHANCDDPDLGAVMAGSPGFDDTTARRDAGRADIWNYETIEGSEGSMAFGGDSDWEFVGPQRGEQAGTVVADLGDVNGDSLDDGAVTSPRYDTGGSTAFADAGRVRVFHGNPDDGPDGDEDGIPDCVDPCPADSDAEATQDECGFCPGEDGCDDGIDCTDDSCNEESGECEFDPDDGDCEDGEECETAECDPLEGCTYTEDAATNCTDGEDCTTPSCDPAGGCLYTPNCTETSECFTASCNEAGECVYTPDNSLCDDDVDCTDDVCSETGTCTNTANADNCTQTNECFDASCDEIDGCKYTPNDENCDDDTFCNGEETCSEAGACVAGQAPSCDDGVGCTDDTCDQGMDKCVNEASDENCDDDLWCNGTETCDAVEDCKDGEAPKCEDDFECTNDSCDDDIDACVNAPDDTVCDDDAFCNGEEYCDEGEPQNQDGHEIPEGLPSGCASGEAPDCDDGIDCTADSCDETNDTCLNEPDDAECDDGLWCNGEERCEATGDGCAPGPPPECDDGVDCTDDMCNEMTDECDHAPNDDFCDDGLFCNGEETCTGGGVALGGCAPGTPPACTDGIDCTDDSCNEDEDVCDHAPNDGACGDDMECTDDICDVAAGCQNPPFDSDNDGVNDCEDCCPDDPNKGLDVGFCPCGVSEDDRDNDGLPDCMDQCPDDPNRYRATADCACLGPEAVCDNGIDDDGDGFTDCADQDCEGHPTCGDANPF